jgi:hypothetical protein
MRRRKRGRRGGKRCEGAARIIKFSSLQLKLTCSRVVSKSTAAVTVFSCSACILEKSFCFLRRLDLDKLDLRLGSGKQT